MRSNADTDGIFVCEEYTCAKGGCLVESIITIVYDYFIEFVGQPCGLWPRNIDDKNTFILKI